MPLPIIKDPDAVNAFLKSLPDNPDLSTRIVSKAAGIAFNILDRDVMIKSRSHDLLDARYAAMFLLIYKCGRSATVVGKAIGREHSTVLHSARIGANRVTMSKWYADRARSAWHMAVEKRTLIEAVRNQRQADLAHDVAATMEDYPREPAPRASDGVWGIEDLVTMNEKFRSAIMSSGDGFTYGPMLASLRTCDLSA